MARTEQKLQEAIRAGEALRVFGRGFAEALSDVGGTLRDLERIGGDKYLLRQFAKAGMGQMVIHPLDGKSCLYTVEAVIPVRVDYDWKYDGRSLEGCISPDRRQDHVKVEGLTGEYIVPLSVVTFGRTMDIEPVEDDLAKGGLRLAISEEFRDFVKVVESIALTLPITACGTSWTDLMGVDRGVLCLREDERERYMHLIWRVGGWDGGWRFLAAPI